MKFKGMICAYCQTRLATSTDHVFAREFFLERHRGNLPQVPACDECNNRKSKFEAYLATVLPFGGCHPTALETLQNEVPRRLRGNRRLHRRLNAGKTTDWRKNSSGIVVRQTALPFDWEKLEDLLVYITIGLMWHHWQVQLDPDYFVDIHADERAARVLRKYAGLNSKQTVEFNLGEGTFVYRGMQGKDNDGVSMWRFSVFGGLTLRHIVSGRNINEFWTMTGPYRIHQSVERRRKAEGSVLIGS